MGNGGERFFFFQAEDGIRDAQESRGIGEVYKKLVLGRCQGDARAVPGRCQGGARAVLGRCQGGARAVPGRCQGGARAVLGRC